MKRMKKLASLLLALVMVMAMAMPAFAANSNPHTITITNDKKGHTYVAYQVFKGDIYNATKEDGTIEKTLSNIEWGDGIQNDSQLITALQAEASFDGAFAGKTSAAEIAEAMKDFTDDQMDRFSEIVATNTTAEDGTVTYTYLKGDGNESTETSADAEDPDAVNRVYTINVTGDGYYIVRDAAEIVAGDAETRYILQVVGNVTVAAKSDAPSVEKTTADLINNKLICNNTDSNHKHTIACFPEDVELDDKFNNGAIGDLVPYEVKSKVPAMDGYKTYAFVVKDTFDAGLTFNGDISIEIGGQEITECKEGSHKHDTLTTNKYHLKMYKTSTATAGEETDNPAEARHIEIVFENFIQYKTDAMIGQDIIINYSATINDDVNLTVSGNENKVSITYPKNPNKEWNGDPDEPDYPAPDEPMGETPESKTVTYALALELDKTDENGNNLAGAEFSVHATEFNKFLVSSTEFVERTEGDEGAVYYLLKDGKYTTEEPIYSDTEDKKSNTEYYANINDAGNGVTKTYKLVSSNKVSTEPGEEKTYTAYVDSNGVLKLEGLSEGTYIFTETKAPNGYNQLKGSIKVEIEWIEPANNSTECTWKITKTVLDEKGSPVAGTADKPNPEVQDNAKIDLYKFPVMNQSGSLLPSTGGIGTTIFYVVGTILVLAAGILLVTKRRMKAQ